MMQACKRYLKDPASLIGLVLLLLVVIAAVSADWWYPGNPLGLAGRPLQWPMENAAFPLGTDHAGRDIAAQLVHGARMALVIGLVAMLLALTLGVLVGALGGYFGGWLDEILMRITDAFQILPSFLLLLVLVAVFGSDIKTITVSIGLVSWPPTARLTRAEFMTLRNREYVQASRTLGQGNLAIIFREILPNALPPVIIYSSVIMATAILLESALAFLNLSDPNVPSWGNLIGTGRNVMRQQWYVVTLPGVAILLTVLGISLVGQGLNDALNPRLRRR
jgi:peptide/nickel transport system permease protein